MSMRSWPLVFTYRGVVKGSGFSALVDVTSRILAEERETDVWLDGAQPGGFAVACADLKAANKALKDLFRNILDDFAHQASSFDAFEATVQHFHDDLDNAVHTLWIGRWMASQRGQLDCGPADDMPRLCGEDTRTEVKVKQLQPATATSTALVRRDSHAVYAVAA